MDHKQETSPWPAQDDGFAWSLIRRKARKLIGTSEYSSAEKEDLEQIFAMELWKCRSSFDETRGTWQGFAKTIVNNSAKKLLRHRRAQKRDDRSTVSLSTTVNLPTGEAVEMAQSITQQERGKHLCVVPTTEVHSDLRLDIASFSAAIPDNWSAVLSLYSTTSTADVAITTGMKRSTLYNLRRRIAKRMTNAGLEKYFEN